MNYKKYWNLTFQVAELSKKHPRVGCTIVGKGFVSISPNLTKSHPIQKELNKLRFNDERFDTCRHGIHAEFGAMLKVKDKSKLKNAKIFIVRLDKNGNLMESKPCPACQELIKKYKLKVIE